MRSIPCIYMRSGTSKGPFIDLRDLPTDPQQRDHALLRIMGSPDAKQIDGIGGAAFVTSKVVMVQPSERPNIDVDYLFAQVIIDKPVVDTRPTCGNMMAGVGPFAIEKRWVKAENGQTHIRVYNINTDSEIEIVVQTPECKVNYTDSKCAIDGVPGLGSPILMNLFDVGGGTTGKIFPTGNRKDIIDGIEVSVVDAGNLMMLAKASAFGLDGTENPAYFESSKELMKKLGALRIKVGNLIGLGDVSDSVLPKIGLLSPPTKGGDIRSQYFTPKTLHPTHAVSGAICISAALLAKGSVVSDITKINKTEVTIQLEHPSGQIPIQIQVEDIDGVFRVVKAGSLRTARKIMEGNLFY